MAQEEMVDNRCYRIHGMDRPTPRSIAIGYLLSIGIWSALSLLTGWNYLIFDQAAHLHSTLTDMILLAEGRGLAYALLTPAVFYLVRSYSSVAGLRVRNLLVYCLGFIPYLPTYACIRWVICPPWNSVLVRFESRTTSSPLEYIRNDFADIISMYFATLLAALAYYYLERARKQELERSEYQLALAASELQALKMQLHPHFLFNTLHGISTLIDSDGKSAKAMIVKLSSLLRKAFEHGNSDLIPLQDELLFVGEYLDLETMRFGSRLTVTCTVDQNIRPLMVPQLILQHLVENAIRHGVACSRDRSWIEITARRTEARVEIRVRNNIGDKKERGTGVGLRNTRARLRHLYADEATFSFEIAPDKIAMATLVLPALGSHLHLNEEPVEARKKTNEAEDHASIDC